MTDASSFGTVLHDLGIRLGDAGVAHALIGGIAVGLHGYARSTGDIDLLVDGAKRDAILKLMESAGFALVVATEEVLHFSGPVPVDMLLARRETTRQMLAEATPDPRTGTMILRVEDIIGLKIQAFCNNPARKWHDQADIAALIQSNPSLEWSRVQRYAAMFGVESLLEEIRLGAGS
jgi:hypothetical protein